MKSMKWKINNSGIVKRLKLRSWKRKHNYKFKRIHTRDKIYYPLKDYTEFTICPTYKKGILNKIFISINHKISNAPYDGWVLYIDNCSDPTIFQNIYFRKDIFESITMARILYCGNHNTASIIIRAPEETNALECKYIGTDIIFKFLKEDFKDNTIFDKKELLEIEWND